jgi:hypothetical protein
MLAQSLVGLDVNKQTDELKADLDGKSYFFRQLQVMSDEFISLSKKAQDSLEPDEHEALINLAKDKSIVITKADKGNAVVIENTTDYLKKVETLIEQTGKFKQLKHDPTKSREKNLISYINSILTVYGKDKEGKIDKNKVIKLHMSQDTGKRIKPRGSRAGVMYGLPKVHKEHTPLRPIISAVKTYNYELAKYLDEILKPLIVCQCVHVTLREKAHAGAQQVGNHKMVQKR